MTQQRTHLWRLQHVVTALVCQASLCSACPGDAHSMNMLRTRLSQVSWNDPA
jgi:hypothetical protein